MRLTFAQNAFELDFRGVDTKPWILDEDCCFCKTVSWVYFNNQKGTTQRRSIEVRKDPAANGWLAGRAAIWSG